MVHALVPVRYPPPVEVPPDVDGEEEREEVRVAVADGGVDGGVAVLETERKLMCGQPRIFLPAAKPSGPRTVRVVVVVVVVGWGGAV